MSRQLEAVQEAREEALGEQGWTVHTPDHKGDEVEYELGMWIDGGSDQMIDLSREEYIGLKEHLARMRGLLPASATEVGDHAGN